MTPDLVNGLTARLRSAMRGMVTLFNVRSIQCPRCQSLLASHTAGVFGTGPYNPTGLFASVWEPRRLELENLFKPNESWSDINLYTPFAYEVRVCTLNEG